MSLVLQSPAALPQQAAHHFLSKLSVETDVSDVWSDLQNGVTDFLLVDVRSEKAFWKRISQVLCHFPIRPSAKRPLPRSTPISSSLFTAGARPATARPKEQPSSPLLDFGSRK